MNKEQFQFIVISVFAFLLVLSSHQDGGWLYVIESIIFVALAVSLIILIELLGERLDD